MPLFPSTSGSTTMLYFLILGQVGVGQQVLRGLAHSLIIGKGNQRCWCGGAATVGFSSVLLQPAARTPTARQALTKRRSWNDMIVPPVVFQCCSTRDRRSGSAATRKHALILP
jgi:hypothetical protein